MDYFSCTFALILLTKTFKLLVYSNSKYYLITNYSLNASSIREIGYCLKFLSSILIRSTGFWGGPIFFYDSFVDDDIFSMSANAIYLICSCNLIIITGGRHWSLSNSNSSALRPDEFIFNESDLG